MAPDPLDNNRNWVRAAMGLKHLKEGLECFVEDEIVKLQSSFLQDICSSHGLPPTTTCSRCKLDNVLPCPTKGFCNRNRGGCNLHKQRTTCANNLCDKIAVKIMNEHRFDTPCWKNTDVTKWSSSPWEIAKCFLANGYSGKMSAKDTDCKGILSVIINCLSLQRSISTYIDPPSDIFSKMSDTRNTIMHSATLEVTDAELQQYIDDMIDILNDSKTIQNHPDAVTARTKLNQIKANTFVISSEDELELRKKAVEDIEQKQKELLDQCQKLQNDIQTKVNQTETSLNQAEIKCQKKQDDLDAKQTELKAQVDQAMTSITQAQLKSKQNQESLQSKVDEAISSIAQAELKSQQGKIDIQSMVDQTQALCLQNQKDLQSKCDKTMISLAQAERQCQQRQDDIESSQSQLSVTLTSLQTQMKQVLDVMSDLQKGTDTHENHMKILEKRQLLQTRLRDKYKRQQSTIPLSPILKNMDVDIDKVYQKLVIRPDLIHDPNVKQLHQRCFSINYYKDIFHNQGRPSKNIFVVGNGGVGKTTWCLKLLNTWLNCKTNTKENDSIFLQRFEYIFYVQLRHTKQASQINDMIRSYIFPDEQCLMDAVDEVLLNEPNQCLVILDGLDEWKLPSEQSILNNGLSYNPTCSRYTTLITSRPWKLEILRLNSSSIDMAVEIEGLDEIGISRFAGHIIDKLNSVRNKQTEVSFFTDCIKIREMPMIEVPLMLSIFVYLWYENEFIGDTLSEVYSKLISNLFKYAEGDKRKIRQNLEVSKLSDIKDIQEIKKKWSNFGVPLPECLNNGSCKTYYPLIYRLGQLAFDGLLSKSQETTLVFTEKSIEIYMNEEKLEVALYVGILSQSQTIGDSTEETFSISFMHKTLQEFFAAVYIVSATSHDENVNINSKFKSYCDDIDHVFEIENVLIFICGLDPKLAGKLTEQISIKHNQIVSCNKNENEVLESLHSVLLRCVREEHLNSNESHHVYIINHFIEPISEYVSAEQTSINTETFSYIQHNCHRIPICMYIELDSVDQNEENCEYEDFICKCFSGVQTLEKLRIYGGRMELYDDKGVLRLLESIKHLQLQTLQIVDITGNLGNIDLLNFSKLENLSMTSIQIEELSLPQDGYLKKVELKSINHPQGAQENFSLTMNNQRSLHSLTLEDIQSSIGHIDLSKNSQLQYLSMSFIQIKRISLPQRGCLKHVKLNYIKHPLGAQGKLIFTMNSQRTLWTLTVDDIQCNIGRIDLSNNLSLWSLSLTSIQIEELLLPQKGYLDTVKLKSIKHPHGGQVKLAPTINNQRLLHSLTLNDIHCNIGHIDLTNNLNLAYLRMTAIEIEELSLPQDGCLQTVELKCINHPQGAHGRFTCNMNNQPFIELLTLEDRIGNIRHVDLSNNLKLERLRMTSLQIEELSLPQVGCLEKVELKSIKHPHGDIGRLTLNMNNQSFIAYLTLEDMIGNIGHIDLSNYSELWYLRMTSIQIAELSLPHDGCLHNVEVKCIKHPQGDSGRLTFNMNKQPHIKSLTLKDIIGNTGHINLSNNSKMTDLSMKSIQIEGLSLPKNGCLQKVVLKSMKHPHGYTGILSFNMNNQPHIEYLTLEDIIGNIGHIDLSNYSKLGSINMTSIHIEGLSLPQNGCLKTVKLKSIEHPHGASGRLTFNMNNQPHIEYLSLDDIIGNIGHIDLSNNSKLEFLRMKSIQIEELSLPQDGCLLNVEAKSIKHPQGDSGKLTFNMNNQPHIESLRLEDIVGNIGHIDMSNNSKLEDLCMISIQIEELSLPQDGCLEEVDLKYIKHLHGAQGRLKLNLNSQPYLDRLTLEDIQCNIGHIDLSKSTILTDVSVKSVPLMSITVPPGVTIKS